LCAPTVHKEARYDLQDRSRTLTEMGRDQSNLASCLPRAPTNSRQYVQSAASRLRESIHESQSQALSCILTDPACPQWERSFFKQLHRRSFSHQHDKRKNAGMVQSTSRIFTHFWMPMSTGRFHSRSFENDSFFHYLLFRGGWK
jgi:hypothetical protein